MSSLVGLLCAEFREPSLERRQSCVPQTYLERIVEDAVCLLLPQLPHHATVGLLVVQVQLTRAAVHEDHSVSLLDVVGAFDVQSEPELVDEEVDSRAIAELGLVQVRRQKMDVLE